MRKKRVLIQTDFSLLKTGFARNAKSVLTHLYTTGKYEIFHYCCGLNEAAPELKKTPWKSIGCVPSSNEKIEEIKRDPYLEKTFHYGSYYLDEVIKDVKPDVYIAAQDIWGIDFAIKKPWFKKITSALWTTLDSLPILPSAVESASKVKNYWIWSDFATKELHKMGHGHVKTVHGCFGDSNFFRLSSDKRKSLRIKNKIPEDAFIIGFVFRNQLRKSVSNLLEGYSKFKEDNPDIKNPRLLLHTNFREGWDIKRFAKEYNISNEEILATHICKNCLEYSVKPNEKQNDKCDKCGAEGSVNTTEVSLGVDEKELNEVYNLMDVYCHPFTSGGQEIPIQEAKLTELITLVTEYSCGEEMCYPEANSLPLEWSQYREFGTGFIKASTSSDSISKQLTKVYKMSVEERLDMGSKAREWALENFSVESVGKFVENFIDDAPLVNEEVFTETELADPLAKIEEIRDNKQWVKKLYKEILKTEVDDNDEGLTHWVTRLETDLNREQVEKYFRGVATKERESKADSFFDKYLNKERPKRILFILPESEREIYLSTSLLDSVKKLYPDHDIYYATGEPYFQMLASNPNIYRVIPFSKELSKVKSLQEEKYFDLVYTPSAFDASYSYYGKKKVEYDLCT